MSYHSPKSTQHDVVSRARRHTIGHYGLGLGPPYLVAPTLGAVPLSASVTNEYNIALAAKIAPYAPALNMAPFLSGSDKAKLLTRPFDFLVDLFDPIETFVSLMIRDYVKKTGKVQITMPFSGRTVNIKAGARDNATGKLTALAGDAALEKKDPAGMNLIRRLRVINAFYAIAFTDPVGFVFAQNIIPPRNDFGPLHSLIPDEVPAGAPVRDHRVTPNDSEAALLKDGWINDAWIPTKDIPVDPSKGEVRIEIWRKYIYDRWQTLFYFDKLDMMKREIAERRDQVALQDAIARAKTIAAGLKFTTTPVVSPLKPSSSLKLSLSGLGATGGEEAAGATAATAAAGTVVASEPIVDAITKIIIELVNKLAGKAIDEMLKPDGGGGGTDGGGGGGGGADDSDFKPAFEPPPTVSSGVSPVVLVGGALAVVAVGAVLLSRRGK